MAKVRKPSPKVRRPKLRLPTGGCVPEGGVPDRGSYPEGGLPDRGCFPTGPSKPDRTGVPRAKR